MKTPNAVDYAGLPAMTQDLSRAGYRLQTPQGRAASIVRIPGGRWDPEKIQRPPAHLIKVHDEKYRCRTTRSRVALSGVQAAPGIDHESGRQRAIPTNVPGTETVVECMEYTDRFTLPDGTPLWVRDFANDPRQHHVRGEASWRGSTSANAYLGKHDDGTPFIYDNGTQTKYLPSPAAYAREAHCALDQVEGSVSLEQHRALAAVVRRALVADVDGENTAYGLTGRFFKVKPAYDSSTLEQGDEPSDWIHAGLDKARIRFELLTGRILKLSDALQEFNLQYAVVRVGAKTLIVGHSYDFALGWSRPEYYDDQSLIKFHASDKAVTISGYGENEKLEKTPIVPAWLNWEKRRRYEPWPTNRR